MSVIRIGTRGSALALAQANWLKTAILGLHPDFQVELSVIRTSGDRFVDRPLRSLGGKGLFVKEIEEALIAGEIDCAIHSMKDVPAEIPPELTIAAVPEREDPRDVLISKLGGDLDRLPSAARLGTCSLRRMALVRALRADLEIVELRGNVDTRLRKLDEGQVDAIVLAAAGLNRLGIQVANRKPFDARTFIPAIGQGALAIETRRDEVAGTLAALDHAVTRDAVSAERAFLARVGGSCHTPIAAHALVDSTKLSLSALIARPDGTEVVRGEHRGERTAAVAIGDQLADRLLAEGGKQIIAEVLGGTP